MPRQIRAKRLRGACASLFIVTGLFLGATFGVVPDARALSELKPADGTVAKDKPEQGSDEPAATPGGIPMPGPLIDKSGGAAQRPPVEVDPEAAEPDQPEGPVEVLSDIDAVPEPVRRMRQMIVEAAASGDIERLRPLLGKGPTETQVGAAEEDDDAVAVLKGQSGDAEGLEILAILLDVLSTNFVHLDAGTPDEVYVWPYFAARPLSSLTPPEKVDLLRLVTAGDFAEMEEFGSYNFYRVGITPDGQWKFFVAGD
ncbi:hypothetical protein [Ensifer soli]|uniref:hypothetical protein n=1 Tax=Ciceribacter sp. sgz301302 TaxID=3342379 RepID=UPI0035B83C6C